MLRHMYGENAIMKSENFEFLRSKHADLADLGGFAETYAHPDGVTALVKLRSFVETVIAVIYDAYHLPRPFTDRSFALMEESSFKTSVPRAVLNQLHGLRIAGNKAVHHNKGTRQDALRALRDAFEVGRWVHVQLDRGNPNACPTSFKEPSPPLDSAKLLGELAAKNAQLEKLLIENEAERRKRSEAEKLIEHTQQQLDALRAEGEKAASVLHLSEETTRRRLIDQMLLDAGWDVGANGKTTKHAGQEVPLTTMPTTSGMGFADYVLYGDDGKPLAVIEAKKTARDAREGQTQASQYADCLERETGQRPVIFYTNGIDIHIWDDAQGYTPRKVYGFYSKDSLEYLFHQRKNKVPLSTVAPSLDIAERMYQLEAVKRVSERFDTKFRRALLVQATGTGKTRVAISLCDLLMRAGWVKRILFLCDRKELRKQADNAFKHYLPNEPRVVVGSATSSDRDKRIYLATYPAMMECYDTFDVGFFDLVIFDESHRSIYRKYRELVMYFDALDVGLTATPLKYADRDTFKLFGCEHNDPTSSFTLEDAIAGKFLVPFRVKVVSSKFRKDGFKYAQMTTAQRAELAEQDENPETVDFEPSQLDRDVFNKDTNRNVLRTLMDEGLREGTGSHVGKSIIFARSHRHAVYLAELFAEMYPQYGGNFCRVIDTRRPRRAAHRRPQE